MPATAQPESRPQSGAPAPEASQEVEFGRFVETRIHQTRSAVLWADVATVIGTLMVMGLGYLLVAALIEHWFLTGGFSNAERVGALAVGIVGAGAYAARRLTPLITRRINPLYAANEIERAAPSLKNSLISLVQLRGQAPAVREALERQAAERLVSAEETSPDRTPLLRTALALLALVVIITAYTAFSPKDFFTTAKRIALPWADIAPPSRVQIEDLQPGTAEIPQGALLEVSTRVIGLEEGDPVTLVYSTRDRSVVERRIDMPVDASGVRYSTRLGAQSGLGLQSDLWYRVEAGDARTNLYAVRVVATPTIAPVSIRLNYSEYTGYSSRELQGSGDISAIEGTRVTLQAESNLPIESAQIDLGSDGKPDVRMKPAGQKASAEFTLRLDGDRRRVARQTTYSIRFTAGDGQANADPARYQLEILPDLPPESAVIEPAEPEVQVRLDEPIAWRVEARDPDFALQRVRLVGEVDGRRRLNQSLLKGEHRGKFVGLWGATAREMGLQPGQTLHYWVEATDSKAPQPNVSVSKRQRLVVLPDENQDQETDGQSGERGAGGEDGQPDSEPDPSQQGDQSGDQGTEPGEQQSEQSQQQPGEQGQQGGQDSEQKESQDSNESGQQPDGGGIQAPGESSPDAESGQQNRGGASGEQGQNDPTEENENTDLSSEGAGEGGTNSEDRRDAQSENQPREDGSEAGAEGEGQRAPGSPSGGERREVPSDGSDDGAAFERIREHFAEQDAQQSQESQQEAGESEDRSESDPQQAADESDARGGDNEAEQRDAREEQGVTPDRRNENEAMEGADPERSGAQSDSQSSDAGGQSEEGQESRQSDSPHEGIGEAGENQAADEGGGQSADQGAGETSGRPGEQQQADDPSGQSGDEAGEGTNQRETSEGDPNGASDASSDNRSNGEPQQDQSRGDNDGDPADQPQSSQTTGEPGEGEQGSNQNQGGETSGGQQQSGDRSEQEAQKGDESNNSTQGEGRSPRGGGEGDSRDQGDSGEEQGGQTDADEANLEYARKQTELVLNRLAEQLAKRDVDRELLDKLGWSEEDLRRLVERWNLRKEQATQGDPTGGSQLDDALRSLGLQPGGPGVMGEIKNDQLRDLNQRSGTAPPPALRDRLRSYNRGGSSSAEGEQGQ